MAPMMVEDRRGVLVKAYAPDWSLQGVADEVLRGMFVADPLTMDDEASHKILVEVLLAFA